MTEQPARWLNRFVTACCSLLIAALALYGAVWLLQAVWVALLVTVVVGVVVTTVVVLLLRGRAGGGW